MNDILNVFEDEFTKSFNTIDDEALGQLGNELESIKLVQQKIASTEEMVKNTNLTLQR